MVLFHYNGPTCQQPEECPPGFHYYFDYAAETEFEFATVEDMIPTEASCRISRGGSGKHRAFFGINNFLQIPQSDLAPTVNELDFVRARVETCASVNSILDVSFLIVDHWSIGGVLEFAKEHNQQLK